MKKPISEINISEGWLKILMKSYATLNLNKKNRAHSEGLEVGKIMGEIGTVKICTLQFTVTAFGNIEFTQIKLFNLCSFTNRVP